MKCTYPEGNSTKQFGEIRVTKVTKPEKKRIITDTTQEDKVCSNFQIRPEWWEPAVCWLENTKWTRLGVSEHNQKDMEPFSLQTEWCKAGDQNSVGTGIQLTSLQATHRSQSIRYQQKASYRQCDMDYGRGNFYGSLCQGQLQGDVWKSLGSYH